MLSIRYLLKSDYFSKNLSGILERSRSFVFLSPHLDDAVFSCGLLLAKLRKLNKKVKVITIFSDCTSSPKTPQSKLFLEQCGFVNGKKLFAERRLEDQLASKTLGFTPVHLNFIDAAWRLNDKNKPVYRSSDIQFSGKVSAYDTHLKPKIINKLKNVINPTEKCVVFAPFGEGGHVDHVLVRNIASEMFSGVFLWSDFPYNLHSKKNNTNADIILYPKPSDFKIKEISILAYKTQISSIFGDKKITKIPEKYYYL